MSQGGHPMTPANAAAVDSGAASPSSGGADQRFSLRETARILEVPEARLRALARAGLLTPQRGPIGPLSFGFRDLLLLRTTKGLLDSGVSMRRIRRIWSSLRQQLAADIPLTSVSIRTDGETVVASDGRTAWQPDSGQFVLDFEAAELAERAGAASPPATEAAHAPDLSLVTGTGPQRAEPRGDTHRSADDASALAAADLRADQWY